VLMSKLSTENWAAVDQLINTAGGKREFAILKKQLDDIAFDISKAKAAPKELDWNLYSKALPASFIKKMKAAVEGLKSPPAFVDEHIEKTAAAFAEIETEVKAQVKKSKARIAELDKEIAAIAKRKEDLASGKITVDDVLKADPALAAEIDKELAEGNWKF